MYPYVLFDWLSEIIFISYVLLCLPVLFRCSFHDGESVINCSRLHVMKQAFGICESLAGPAGFELVEGAHKPKVCCCTLPCTLLYECIHNYYYDCSLHS